jgi:hypothetical protein
VVYGQLIKAISLAQELSPPPQNREPKPAFPFEARSNLVTLHDLHAYSSMLYDKKHEGLLGDWTSQYIDSKAFLGKSGRIYSSPFATKDICGAGYLIFGPYMELPAGHYRATFDVALEIENKFHGLNKTQSGLLLDIAAGDVLAMREVALNKLSSAGQCSVEFTIDRSVSNLEFRIKAYGIDQLDGFRIVFSGINLARNRLPDIANSEAKDADLSELASIHANTEATVVSQRELLSIQPDEAFLEACYRKIFGRSTDSSGRKTYLALLKQGDLSRSELISILVCSPEGHSRGVLLIDRIIFSAVNSKSPKDMC